MLTNTIIIAHVFKHPRLFKVSIPETAPGDKGILKGGNGCAPNHAGTIV